MESISNIHGWQFFADLFIILQGKFTHIRNMSFIHFYQEQGNDNEKNKEYQQGCDHVLICPRNLIYELFEHAF